jgi:hypothetical protein
MILSQCINSQSKSVVMGHERPNGGGHARSALPLGATEVPRGIEWRVGRTRNGQSLAYTSEDTSGNPATIVLSVRRGSRQPREHALSLGNRAWGDQFPKANVRPRRATRAKLPCALHQRARSLDTVEWSTRRRRALHLCCQRLPSQLATQRRCRLLQNEKWCHLPL